MKKFSRCRIILITGLFILCYMVGAQADVPIEFFANGNLLHASVDGTAQYSANSIAGTKLDFNDDFQFDDVTTCSLRIGGIIHKKHEVLFDYRQFSFSGETFNAPDATWGGMQFSTNIQWEPTLDLRMMKFCYGYRLIENSAGFVALRPGIQIVRYDTTIDVPGVPILDTFQASYAETRTLPTLILAGDYRMHRWFALAGEFSGGMINEQSGYDVLVMLRVLPHRHVALSVGYTWQQYTDERDNNHFETQLGSPVVGVHVEW